LLILNIRLYHFRESALKWLIEYSFYPFHWVPYWRI